MFDGPKMLPMQGGFEVTIKDALHPHEVDGEIRLAAVSTYIGFSAVLRDNEVAVTVG